MIKFFSMKKPELMSVPELAARTGLTRVWVWNLIQRRQVPAQKVGNVWLCPPEAVAAVKARPNQVRRKAKS